IDITLTDLAADVRAPTPSAAAEMVTASRVDLSRRVQELKALLLSLINGRLEKIDLLISRYSAENLEHDFRIFFQSFWQKYDDISEELLATVKDRLTKVKHQLELIAGGLAAHSPMDTLKRGYAVVVHRKSGTVLLSAEKVEYDDELSIRLYKGGLTAGVKEIRSDEEL
ncbi:MAG: exodeoxyribonuclease VII large subunit, partial [Spirochaeta sp.]|nr:exodeoxyribonuclease VII large subunit [Spirochaeta sp.]